MPARKLCVVPPMVRPEQSAEDSDPGLPGSQKQEQTAS
ncbi:hypothetical protein PspLS_11488 [Pyricularia sp. CBS 133598]|nr:hypothetical protein PspLS_11488 [Pyricularia sp. CBS 133598]